MLGAIQGGGSGCACPENVLLRSLVQDIVLHRDEALFMDMEPGIEHIGRATARGVTSFIVVVEPGHSLEEDAVIEFAAQRLARYKCPQKVNFVDELPLNLSGKVLRRALR